MPYEIGAENIWNFLLFWQNEFLLFAGCCLLLGAMDDFAVDLIWIIRRIYRRLFIYRGRPRMRAQQLPEPKSRGLLVVFVAAWQEANVIGNMLARTSQSWNSSGKDYRVYVGCYPNDSATVDAVITAAHTDPHIRLVVGNKIGPTTKADCLNRLWQALIQDEAESGILTKAIILHDAEDAVHPEALKVFDYLIEKAQAVQLPVIPVAIPGSPWISGHYCDEFTESHRKSLIVREAIGAAMPLAGVGCAIDRNHLGRIAQRRDDRPFDDSSLTEDYELGLGIGEQGGKVILARLLDQQGKLVATRCCFPDKMEDAIRQKARWITGIALAGWDRLGWSVGWAEWWMRLRDRKAILCAIVLATAYSGLALTLLLWLGNVYGQLVVPPLSPTLHFLILANTIMLAWRLSMRLFWVSSEYGLWVGLLSIPRMVVANMISICAVYRACLIYIQHVKGKKLRWDKTQHNHFPYSANGNG
jgi:bacteriophage N4 adsorption protein B